MPRKKQSNEDKPLSIEEARAKIEKAVNEQLAGNDPGPIIFRLKSTRKASDPYALKLTQQQREALIRCTRIRGKLKKKLEDVGVGTQVVEVNRKELERLNDELGRATMYAKGQDQKRLSAVMGKVAELLAEDHAGLFEPAKSKPSKATKKKDGLLYQFKITLLDIEPAIWRRIQVMDCTLADLHEIIQAAMGWWNYHLHQFEIKGKVYCDPAPDGEYLGMDCEDEAYVRLSNLVPKSGRRSSWLYEYDLGDGWRHEILFEGFPPVDPKAKYPLCLEGERNCPPEDCGGPWGFLEYLAAIRDPSHEEHAGMLEWRGEFDPEAFDAKKATSAMKRALRQS